MDFKQNEKGVTLIEILVSIVILSIVFMSVMQFFPQMALMNNNNIIKTQGINNAKQILNNWQEDSSVKNFINGTTTSIPNYIFQTNPLDSSYYIFNSTDGSTNIMIKRQPDNNTGPMKAYRIYIKLLNKNGTIKSEIYGYIFN